jgi:DNA repair protein RecO (recombination protein O)
MIEKTTGLVLRLRPLTETSLIVHWLTPDLGRFSTVAKGARRPKSPLRLDLFYAADFTFQRSRRSDLHTLREARILQVHAPIREDVARLQQASYGALLVEQSTEPETPLPEIHTLFTHLLEQLEVPPVRPETIFAFELRLLDLLGLGAPLEETALPPGTKAAARALASAPWEMLSRIHLSEVQSAGLRSYLHGYIIYHLGRLPRGRQEALNPA